MPPTPDELDLRLRLVVAAERLGTLTGDLKTGQAEIRAEVAALKSDHAAHRQRVEPVIEAHGRWLAGLEREQTEAAAEGVTAADRAKIAAQAEAEARAKLRTEVWTWAARILIPLALGGAGYGGWVASQSTTTPTPAQDALGAAP